ncbi:LamG-like jellyroll fold domain-containing protein [Actinopolymorpha sp. B17G11]|uniref:LamG-like jellyroll fold domain-containing protein n=1 Tax=Actinopolymorpha sp. B17G11 TaxID=3160861 RepID=UPI0032E52E1B
MTDVAFDADFTVALWLVVPADRPGSAGGLATTFDPTSRTGFNLGVISSAGGYNGPGDELRVSFGIDAGTDPRWIDCGRPSPSSNLISNSLTVFDGHLHAASTDAPAVADWAHVYRHHGGKEWEDLGQVGKGAAHGVGPLIVHCGSLYAATWNYDWTRVDTEDLTPCRVYRYEGPGRWEDCGQPGASRRLYSLASYRGDLYVAGDDCSVHVYRGDRTWEKVRSFASHAHPMTVHDGSLVLATLNPATVWTYDGTTWTDLGNPLGDEEHCNQIHTLDQFDEALHLGSWPLGKVVRWGPRSTRWKDLGRLGDSTEVQALASYNGMLYAGAIPRSEVFRYDGDHNWTSVRRFYDRPRWEPLQVCEVDDTPRGERGLREWSRVTSLTQHAGMLFASTGSCTGAAADAPADVRGTVHAMSAGVTATTAHSLEPGRHHIAAVRRGGAVSVYVDGRLAATAHGEVTGSLATVAGLRVGPDVPGAFRGEVQDFGAYDHALDRREIEELAAQRPD